MHVLVVPGEHELDYYKKILDSESFGIFFFTQSKLFTFVRIKGEKPYERIKKECIKNMEILCITEMIFP